jgi:16S rRNA (uracil1498-N3)-methyltransferase
MGLPLFYTEAITAATSEHMLDEDSSRHIVQVLRMKAGEQIALTNGKGFRFISEISHQEKKKVTVIIRSHTFEASRSNHISIAISLVKNTARFEWFLEKATEIGVSAIIPFISARTEKQRFRYDRMQNIVISAMLQSQQSWIPDLREPLNFKSLLQQQTAGNKFVAHCENDQLKTSLLNHAPFKDSIILIGPEGDFTKEEIALAAEEGYQAVALGNTRLRTETAGMVSAALLCNL